MTFRELAIRVKESDFLFLVLALLMALLTVGISLVNQTLSFAFIGFLMMVILLLVVLRHPIYATLINIFVVYLGFFFVYRIFGLPIPLGVLIDSLNVLALLVLIIRGQLAGHETPIGIFIFVWFGMNFLEFLNPNAVSRVAWVLAMRGLINMLVPFYLFYSYFKTQKNALKIILNLWMILGAVTALYTLYQEFAGYPPWDMDYIKADEEYYNLVFTFGRLRKIGTLSGPSENGIILAINSVIALGFYFNQKIKKRVKFLYLIIFIVSLWAMLYTGARTAIVVGILGIVFYIILSKKRQLMILGMFFFVIVFPFMVATGKGGPAARVMFTAFNSDDPSLQVRYSNQKILRNFIFQAPIGYGVGSTGGLAKKYSPNTFIANYPTDSEYVKVAVQFGYIGLAIWLSFQYVIVNTGIKTLYLYREESNNLNLLKVMICVALMFVITQYPQEVLILPVPKLLYSLCMAVLCLKPEDIDGVWTS